MKRIVIFTLVILLMSSLVLGKSNINLINSPSYFHSLDLDEKHYITPIKIINTNSYDTNDIQVNITLNSLWEGWNYVQPDGSDIIITDNNGNILPYWIEEWNYTNKKVIIWVKIPSIPSNGFNRIFIHYGNPSFTSHSNGDQVFEFFDDFNGNSLDTTKWVTNTNTYKVENGYIKMWGDWNSDNVYINTIKSFNTPVMIVGKFRLGQVNSDTDLVVGMTNNSNFSTRTNGYFFAYDGESTSLSYGVKRIESPKTQIKTCGLVTDTNWHRFRTIITNNSLYFWDDLLGECNITGYGMDKFYISIYADTDSSSRFGYIDWIGVIKYIDNEPIITVNNMKKLCGLTFVI